MMDRLRLGAGWLVHLYTAMGAVVGLLALTSVMEGQVRQAFLWLAAATLIDATDGWLARRTRVSQVVPQIDGALLDNIVDYLTYVFVPAVLMLHAGLFPPGVEWVTSAAVIVASGIAFSRTDAKTDDHYFTGFPSYWNIVALYLFAAEFPRWGNTAIVAGLVALTFVPIGYVYPSRTRALRGLTLVLGAAWAVAAIAMIWQLPQVDGRLLWASALFPAYYFALSFILHFRRTLA